MESRIISNQQTHSIRNYGIDLLRCLAMMMVVMLHTLSKSGLLYDTVVGSLKYEASWFIEIFCYCAVDCFVLISGYVGVRCKFKFSRIILLWLQVVFYNVVCSLIFQGVNGEFDFVQIILRFLPVSTNSYWFFTHYFALCFMMPFINKIILKSTFKQNAVYLSFLLVLFSVLPAIYGIPFAKIDKFDSNIFYTERGYSIIWLVVVYALGAFIKRCQEEKVFEEIKPWTYFIIIIVSDIFVWAIHYMCVNREKPVSHNFMVSYTSPFIVINAVSFLLLFSKFNFSKNISKAIEFFSSGAFAVYLIHSQEDVYPIYAKMVSPIADYRLLKVLPCLIFTVVFVFVVCTVIDFVRGKLFGLLRIDKLSKTADKLPVVNWLNNDH